jgi:hypothetical protein
MYHLPRKPQSLLLSSQDVFHSDQGGSVAAARDAGPQNE